MAAADQVWRSDARPLGLDVDEIETAERHLSAESIALRAAENADRNQHEPVVLGHGREM